MIPSVFQSLLHQRKNLSYMEEWAISPIGLISLREKLLTYFEEQSPFSSNINTNHETHFHPKEEWRSFDVIRNGSEVLLLLLDRDTNDYPFAEIHWRGESESDRILLRFESDRERYPHTTLMVEKAEVFSFNDGIPDAWQEFIRRF